MYTKCMRECQKKEQDGGEQKERELRSLREQHAEVVQNFQRSLREKNMALAASQHEIKQLREEKDKVSQEQQERRDERIRKFRLMRIRHSLRIRRG